MTDFTLSDPLTVFPEGTTVKAYPESNWGSHVLQPSGAPAGASAATAAVTSGALTFTGLTSGVTYWAVADIDPGAGTNYRYVRFTVGADESLGQIATDAVATEATDRASAIDDEATARAAADTTEAAARATGDTTTVANTQTADYTLVLGDAGKCVEINAATAKTLTIPTNASVAFPVGTKISLTRIGAGTFTVAAAGGVTLRSPGSKVTLASQYSSGALRKRAADEWVLSGDLA